MHIPDGYLSPATCVVLYAGSAPFWYASLQRMKRALSTEVIPRLSIFAAFSFIIMMFNLPLPGGTTGHAVGVGIAAIVLGPWGSILAISIALVIQAVLFGDGGITSLGANCFNMAVVGSLVAYATYRAVSRHAPIDSPRRVIAAALAGYLSINISALLAAIELGVQPLLYHDASGAPLYAPYPLSIAIPAMMTGHLCVAGPAEMVLSAGVVAYLQKAEPSLLTATAPGATLNGVNQTESAHGWWALRRLWLALAALLMLTPLGILAVGSAWGEWSPEDFSDRNARQQIAASSGHHEPPVRSPAGLQRLASFWTAPMSRYAPQFLKSAGLGYLLSAMAGTGLIISIFVFGGWLFQAVSASTTPNAQQEPLQRKSGQGVRPRRQINFVERTISSLLAASEYAAAADETARGSGALQRVDPRVKVVGLLGLIFVVAASHRLSVIGGMFVAAVCLALFSHIAPNRLVRFVWIPALFFSGAIALPAVFLTPGRPLLSLAGIYITVQGLRTAAFLVSRAETAAMFSSLLVLTTPWPSVLKALRVLKCPVVLVAILGMTYRYIFVVLHTAFDMFESRKSRTVGFLKPMERRRLAASAVGVLISKSFQLSGDVHLAMKSRGFRGEIHILQQFRAGIADGLWLAGFAFCAIAALWLGR